MTNWLKTGRINKNKNQKRNHKTNKQTVLWLIIHQNTLNNQRQFMASLWSRKSHQGTVADAVSTWWGKPVNFIVARKQNKITKTEQRLLCSVQKRSPVLLLLPQLWASQKRVEKVCKSQSLGRNTANSIFWTRNSYCNQEFTAAMVTCINKSCTILTLLIFYYGRSKNSLGLRDS